MEYCNCVSACQPLGYVILLFLLCVGVLNTCSLVSILCVYYDRCSCR